MNKVTVKLNYLHIAPRKVRLVGNVIKGLSVNEAEAQLMFRAKRSSLPILKLLKSAVANAKINNKLNPDNLFIKDIQVNEGPMLKRFLPRAMGRATPIHKKTSHIILILAEREKAKPPRFTIPTLKKTKTSKKQKSIQKPETKPERGQAIRKNVKENPSFFKRLFNRKSV